MSEYFIKKYEDSDEIAWERIINGSKNGTMLQTRKFLNYHEKGKFLDDSLIIYKGNNFPIAVVPGNVVNENGKKIFISHQGSTFGGLIILKEFYNLGAIKGCVEVLGNYFKEQKFDEVYLKITGDIFSKGDNNLIYYYLYLNGYDVYDELSFYIDFQNIKGDPISNLGGKCRNEYKKSLTNGLVFKKIDSDKDIKKLHELLEISLKKYNTKPVHSYEDLLLLYKDNLKDKVEFYGVFKDDLMIAGGMIFLFDNVFHAQYLPGDPNYLNLYPLVFLDTNLILEAQKRGFRYFSYGISTENHGKYLNESLAKYKEGFGCDYCLNKTYYKRIK